MCGIIYDLLHIWWTVDVLVDVTLTSSKSVRIFAIEILKEEIVSVILSTSFFTKFFISKSLKSK